MHRHCHGGFLEVVNIVIPDDIVATCLGKIDSQIDACHETVMITSKHSLMCFLVRRGDDIDSETVEAMVESGLCPPPATDVKVEQVDLSKKTINLRICKSSITAEESWDVRGSVSDDGAALSKGRAWKLSLL